MSTISQGQIPEWMAAAVLEGTVERARLEIEIKLIIPRESAFSVIRANNASEHEIEQLYLTAQIVESFSDGLNVPEDADWVEWRIRRKDSSFFFTTKGISSAGGAQRREYETKISQELFCALRESAVQEGSLLQVKKTRYNFLTRLADEDVLIEIDDYHATGQGSCELDFVSCEIEVPRLELANILQKGNYFSPSLQFLKLGLNVTGMKPFSNRSLAEHGFIREKYKDILVWLTETYVSDLSNAADAILTSNHGTGIKQAKDTISKIEAIHKPPPTLLDPDDIRLTQDVLVDLRFSQSDSMGRKDESDTNLAKIDTLGKGWLRDYHEIISAPIYIRLFTKPQVFRPGLGYSNITTRGAHTSDVTAAALQLARQLGLNAELCMAGAAMHDVGHAAGGHVGEKLMYGFSGRRFNHHIFSLSLVEMFGLNILREVQLCSFYHKSGGKKLMAPTGRPQEFGIVRISDKLAYTAWDLFDSIENMIDPKNWTTC